MSRLGRGYGLIMALIAILAVAGCQKDAGSELTVAEQTTPGGVVYHLATVPDAERVAVQIMWHNVWTATARPNQMVPFVAARALGQSGSATTSPADLNAAFSRMQAEAVIVPNPDGLVGVFSAPKDEALEAARLAGEVLASPSFDVAWFNRTRDAVKGDFATAASQEAVLTGEVLRRHVLPAGPLLDFTGLASSETFDAMTVDDMREWHAASFSRRATIALAGNIDADMAGAIVDALVAGLPDIELEEIGPSGADFAPATLVLETPDATKAWMSVAIALPPLRGVEEYADLAIAQMFAGGPDSVLFETLRTKLGATYGFQAQPIQYTKDSRFLFVTGEVDVARIDDVHASMLSAYANFIKHPPDPRHTQNVKSWLSESMENVAKDPQGAVAVMANLLVLDMDPQRLGQLPQEVSDTLNESTVFRRKAVLPDGLVIAIVAPPGAPSIPDACVVTALADVPNCL